MISEYSISRKEYRLLKKMKSGYTVDARVVSPEANRLSAVGLVSVEYDTDLGHSVARINDAGISFANSRSRYSFEKKSEFIRWLITTIIAVAAFVKSFFYA